MHVLRENILENILLLKLAGKCETRMLRGAIKVKGFLEQKISNFPLTGYSKIL